MVTCFEKAHNCVGVVPHFSTVCATLLLTCPAFATGEWDENVFKGLDFVVTEASKRGIKLVLALSNYWKQYGGFPAYIR